MGVSQFRDELAAVVAYRGYADPVALDADVARLDVALANPGLERFPVVQRLLQLGRRFSWVLRIWLED